MNHKSAKLYQLAVKKIPGGVNSPVRAWKGVGGFPRFIARGKGAYIRDVDGKEYIDFVGSWGPLVLGHVYFPVMRQIEHALRRGTTFGAPTEIEVRLADLVCRLVPSVERLRLVSSGTEATMSAIRLARAFTRRPKILKFDGCYHGHSDGLLVKAGSGIATLSLPDSPGVLASVAKETLVVPYNDVAALRRVFSRHGRDLAAVIVEPVCGNMGVIPPLPEFLPFLRNETRRYGTLLIFDEVITGFRVALGGAQDLYGVTPDLTCLGKILGGGLPLAGFGGRRDIMDLLAPEGPVYQAGTLSGNPLAVTAGLATLRRLARKSTYKSLEQKGKKLADGFAKVLKNYRMTGTVNRIGSMLTVFFGVERVVDATTAKHCDREKFARFFHGMLKQGIYLPPAPFEAAFVSLAHSTADLEQTISAFAAWAAAEKRRS